MSKPSISVIIPTYNHADYVGAAIKSALTQNVAGMELVVIDDGSQDETAARAEAVLSDQQVVPWHMIHQENQGAHTAINNGIAASSGEYVTILNSDDRFLPGRLSALLHEAHKSGSRFLFTRILFVDSNGVPLAPKAPHNFYYTQALKARKRFAHPNFEFLRHNWALTTGNFFMHRSLIDQVGGFSPYIICHDWDYALRSLLVEDLVFIDKPLYEYRVHQTNTMSQTSQDVRWQEIDQVIANYLHYAESASNPKAPCQKNYPDIWEKFLASEIPHLANLPLIQESLAAYDLHKFRFASNRLKRFLDLLPWKIF
ncbi:MAG: hypothetical protein CVU44_15540 [Chloroflexi bacterium HGW-Chloroflexi-6]|nr:MAG: hypothetical protein CVU44_15540 [Chloroflexi bacterium HGW-Chloroflexi-6]